MKFFDDLLSNLVDRAERFLQSVSEGLNRWKQKRNEKAAKKKQAIDFAHMMSLRQVSVEASSEAFKNYYGDIGQFYRAFEHHFEQRLQTCEIEILGFNQQLQFETRDESGRPVTIDSWNDSFEAHYAHLSTMMNQASEQADREHKALERNIEQQSAYAHDVE